MPKPLFIALIVLAILAGWMFFVLLLIRHVKSRLAATSTWEERRQEKLEALQQECELFISQAPPRVGIPKCLFQANRIAWGDAVAAGTMLSLTAGSMLIIPLMFMKASLVLTVGLCTSVGILTGCAIVTIYSRSSKRRKHILEHGVLASGAAVARKETLPNAQDGTQNRGVSFEFEINGETRTATAKISDPYPDLSKRYWDGDLPVKLLVDPLDSDTVLWVDAAVIAFC